MNERPVVYIVAIAEVWNADFWGNVVSAVIETLT
jgi:hypothetical protein